MPRNEVKIARIKDILLTSVEGRRHVRFFGSIPDHLVPFMPGFWWNQDKLFALNLVPSTVRLADLEEFLEIPIWRATGQSRLFSVTGRQILESPGQYQEHWDRVIQANTDFPITMYVRQRGNVLLDGYHRCLRAFSMGLSSLPVVHPTTEQLAGVLETEGFLGELNDISRFDCEFISMVRLAAREILANGPNGDYPAWK